MKYKRVWFNFFPVFSPAKCSSSPFDSSLDAQVYFLAFFQAQVEIWSIFGC